MVLESPPRGARSGGHDSCQGARTAATCTSSRGGARLGSPIGLKVSVRCSEVIRSHVDGWNSCVLQLCCCTATKKAESEPATLIIFLVGCAAAAAGACAAYISTEAERGTGSTVSSFYVSILYTAMLRTSIAAVVIGCFYFCPLDCDASLTVVDGAAVETGCMLEKYIKVATKYLIILFFWSRCCCCCCSCCVQLLLHTTSVLKRREAADELQRPSRTVHRVLDCSIAEHT